jgi:hypothetical protein
MLISLHNGCRLGSPFYTRPRRKVCIQKYDGLENNEYTKFSKMVEIRSRVLEVLNLVTLRSSTDINLGHIRIDLITLKLKKKRLGEIGIFE